MKDYILEACTDSVESAVIATRAGANRLELCANLIIGGTTPTAAQYMEVRRHCSNRIHVLIRPRFGDFCYSEYELEICRREVEQFRELGADGVVLGVLRPDGTLDRETMERLMETAGGLPVTLHRAFDVCKHPTDTLEAACELGISAILTSGQKNTCMEGRELIASLVRQSRGRLDILAGSGVNSEVIPALYEAAGVVSFHMSGKIVLDSRMRYRREDVHMGLEHLSEYEIWQTGEENIRRAVEVLKGL